MALPTPTIKVRTYGDFFYLTDSMSISIHREKKSFSTVPTVPTVPVISHEPSLLKKTTPL